MTSMHLKFGLITVGLVLAACDPAYAPKSVVVQSPDLTRTEIRYLTSFDTLKVGQTAEYRVILKNLSPIAIESRSLKLSYLWWDGSIATIGSDGIPVPLLPPNTDVAVTIPVRSLVAARGVALKIDLLDSNGYWVSDSGKFKPLHYVVDILHD